MSSTKRGAVREKNDFYATPAEAAQPAMDELRSMWGAHRLTGILDAGAGMGAITRAARQAFGEEAVIRAVEAFPEDMPLHQPVPMEEYPAYQAALNGGRLHQGAEDYHARLLAAGATAVALRDYLFDQWRADIVVSNPPFSIAMEFLRHTVEGPDPAITAFLLRLNFLGSEIRAPWLDANPPRAIRILTHRPDFTGSGGDSIEYAWMFWGRGVPDGTKPIGWYR